MASRGARHLIVPSRSGAASGAAAELVSELAERGINVCTPKCDASNAESLSDLLDACAKSMLPIRGCINATMMLNVRLPMHTLENRLPSLAGRDIRQHESHSVGSDYSFQSPHFMEPPHRASSGSGFLHHVIVGGRCRGQHRSVQLCSRLHLPRRTRTSSSPAPAARNVH